MDNKYKVIIGVIVGALILSLLLLAFRGMAIKNAYDASAGYAVILSNGTVVNVAGSSVDPATVATIYGLLTGLVWVIAVVACLVIAIKF